MADTRASDARVVQAVHGLSQSHPDPAYEVGLAAALREEYGPSGLTALYARFGVGTESLDYTMRRVILRALSKKLGNGVRVEPGVAFRHPETFELGDKVFLGTGSFLQGRFDGRCQIGNHVWIGPHSYFDARDLVLEDYVGWGPGAKVLGSEHTGQPTDVPIIQTDLVIRPVRVEEWADIGTNAVLLPGVTVGKAAIVGAGALVNRDVPPFSIVAGVPAKFVRWRDEHDASAARSLRGPRPGDD